MSGSRITDRDNGLKAFRAKLAAGGASVKVGIIGANASKSHEGGGADMATIGEAHEFGLGTLEGRARSWLRATIDGNRTAIEQRIRRAARAVMNDDLRYSAKMTPETALGRVGAAVVGDIVQRIQSGIPPQVTEKTQARKGPDKTTPLINSGQFIGSITHEVIPGGREGA